MKRTLKIIGITGGILISIVLIAVLIVCHIILTPKRLTPIVNRVVDSVLLCEHHLDEVELTIISTFPDAGLRIKGLYILNPMDGAPSDTVLAVQELVAAVDIKKAIKGDIFIEKLTLSNAEANVYINKYGLTNVDILRLSADSVQEQDEKKDTIGGWRLNSIGWKETIALNATHLHFIDDKDSISARIDGLKVNLTEKGTAAIPACCLELFAPHISAVIKDEPYAQDLNVSLTLPIRFDSAVHIDGTQLAFNQFQVALDGSITVVQSCGWTDNQYLCDLKLRTTDWRISELMALLPESYVSLLPEDIQADGMLSLSAHAYGQYDSLSLPFIDGRLLLTDAQGQYKPLPYFIDALEADIEMHADLNQKSLTTATIHKLYAHTKHSSLTVRGTATDLLKDGDSFEPADLLCDLRADVKLDLADADYFIHSDSLLNQVLGTVRGTLFAKARLSDITAQHYERVRGNARLAFKDLDLIWQDSLLAQAEGLNLDLVFGKKVVGRNLTAEGKAQLNALHAQLLSSSIDVSIPSGTLTANATLDLQDTTVIPSVACTFDLTEFTTTMDTIHAHLLAPKGKAAIAPSRRDGAKPRLEAALAATKLQADMGHEIALSTNRFDLSARAVYNKDADNLLLQWNPRLQFKVVNGDIAYATLGTTLDIPLIDFTYSNRVFQIDTSRIDLGNSDLSLAGEIHNVGKWLRKEGELTGQLKFTSEVTDVNELMRIVNRFTAVDDSTATAATEPVKTVPDTTETEPFIVPKHMDLSLQTHIRTAYFEDETLEHLGGLLYVKDGKLVLEEMGFICEAAKMQLTALYESPRRDHLYAGLDFHLIDIDIHNLIRMIPQVDSLVPMLRSFEGKAQFHLTLETYLNSQYKPKISTLRGACDIEGKDLVLLDTETFEKISKILLFSPKQRNLVDSINCQMALYKDRVTVYPLCLSIDKYMAAVGGNHNLDMTFDYHASLLKPIWLGVDVSGNFDDLNIKLAPCRYMQDFRPIFHKDREGQSAELRHIIANTIKKDVKIQ